MESKADERNFSKQYWWNDTDWTIYQSTWRKSCPSATSFTINLTWTTKGTNLGLHGDMPASGIPRNFVWGGSTNSVEDRGQREWGSGGGSPLVRGSGGSCNLVQEISFHIVKFS